MHKNCLCSEVYYTPTCPVHCRSYHEGEKPKWERALEIKKELKEDCPGECWHAENKASAEHMANIYMDRCAELIHLIRGSYDTNGRN